MGIAKIDSWLNNLVIVDAPQGSLEWLRARAESDGTASEAPAMMGASPYTSRLELLDQKRGRIVEAPTPAKQALFDRGHKAEESMRTVIELDTMDTLHRLTMVREVEGMLLLASLDGITSTGKTIWEHKLWNKTLAENVKNSLLDPQYYWQLEHQLLVSGAEEAIFTVSDGTTDNVVSMEYTSVPERRASLIAGWKQFHKDLEGHELKAKKELVTANKVSLPALVWNVEGTEITSNLNDIVPIIKELAEHEMSKDLVTDQDFADKDALNKATKKARENLKHEVESVTNQFSSYALFRSAAAELDTILQKMQSAGEKAVAAQKELRKKEIKMAAAQEMNVFLGQCNKQISPVDILSIPGASQLRPDFDAVTKGLKSLNSMEEAVHEEVARVKVGLTMIVGRVCSNLTYLRTSTENMFLFNDLAQIVGESMEAFSAIVTARLAAHEQEQAAKEAAMREKVERELQEKAERERRDEERRLASEAMRQGQEEARKRNDGLRKNLQDHSALVTEMEESGFNVSPPPAALQTRELDEELDEELSDWQRKWNISPLAFSELREIIGKYK